MSPDKTDTGFDSSAHLKCFSWTTIKELIKTQERLSKLEDIVKKLGPSRDLNETPPGNITVQANQNPSQGLCYNLVSCVLLSEILDH